LAHPRGGGIDSKPKSRGLPVSRRIDREFASFSQVPVGSPFRFSDSDWTVVKRQKSDTDTLYVVFSYQFKSARYDSHRLVANVRKMFNRAVRKYNQGKSKAFVSLKFHALRAGYGGHLFNRIARDIIGADIGVFETSDRNTNVYLEMGVALTWGIEVLPIKTVHSRTPSSDISGQTWAAYRDSAAEFVSPDHKDDLVDMIASTIHNKQRANDQFERRRRMN
jgi:hypothetical protein